MYHRTYEDNITNSEFISQVKIHLPYYFLGQMKINYDNPCQRNAYTISSLFPRKVKLKERGKEIMSLSMTTSGTTQKDGDLDFRHQFSRFKPLILPKK